MPVEDCCLNVFKDTKLREDICDLEGSPHPHLDYFLGRKTSYIPSLEKNMAFIAGVIPSDQIKESGLACTIRPDYTMNLAILCLHINPSHSHQATKRFFQSLYFKNRHLNLPPFPPEGVSLMDKATYPARKEQNYQDECSP